MKKLLLFLFCSSFLFASQCSPYYNPMRFLDAPDGLDEILKDYEIKKDIKIFKIVKTELYQYADGEIAEEINDNFGGLWYDWIEDGYEMKLTPEQTLFHYKDSYLSMEVFIYGVKGDATKRTTTQVKYIFYNYTNEVEEHIKCKKKYSLIDS